MKKIIFTFLLFAGIMNFAYSQVISIDSVRRLDANGVPLLNGQHVQVKGVVTTHQELGVPTVYFQVPSAGLCAYDATFGAGVTRGDSIIVTGLVTNYNGLIELQPVDSFRVLTPGVTTPSPVVITPTQARNGELWESRLIRINGITQVKTTSGVPATTWTTSSSGTNYWLFVGSDSCQIRIYTSTNIAGTTIPQYPFSVVAIMSQFTSSPPYNTGYQIIPRDLNDIINTSGGPTIAALPIESNISQTGITLSYNTLSSGDTKVKYFVSDSIGQPVIFTDSVYNPTLVSTHSINLTNLSPGKIYYALVSSTNANGTSTIVKYFGTQSHTGSTGKMEAYFNYPIEPSVTLPNNLANGSANYLTRLKERIDSAQFSIDLAIYSYNDLTALNTALISAMVRGVKIRIVYDSRNIQTQMQELINAGIPVQQRNFATSSLMHNKFFVFDGRSTNELSYSKKWIWTGSSNITYQQFYQDIENVIFVQDEALCNAYTREFEEMWGSHNNVNNPANAKFGTQKADNTPHVFNVNGRRVECYFSPSDDISSKIENVIGTQTNFSVNFCIYSFTKFSIENKMHSVYNYPTRMVRGVFDRSTNGNLTNGPVYFEMSGIGGTSPWNPPAKVYLDNYNASYLFHDKYILIDAETPSSNPVVMTGSFNFSNAANFDNDENELIVYDSLVANQYYQDFVKRLTDAGGTIGVKTISNVVPDNYLLEQNYPNPFNPTSIIRYSIPKNSFVSLKVYDMVGREVKSLVNQNLLAGKYEVSLDMSEYSSGMYFYKIQVGSFTDTKKMVLVK